MKLFKLTVIWNSDFNTHLQKTFRISTQDHT